MKFEFLVPAAREFREAFDWYARRSERSAEEFRSTVRQAIDLVIANSGSAGFLVGKRARKIPLSPFRYGLIFFVHHRRIYVVAISPNRRPPHYWKRRISNP